MDSSRFKLLAGLALLLFLGLLWHWISGWGLVTLNADKTPLAKVLSSIERQAGISIATNADLTTPVTLQTKRSPVFDVLDTLAVRLDGNAQLAFLAAPEKSQITGLLDAFKNGSDPGGWVVYSSGFGGRMGDPSVITLDPRDLEWKLSPVENNHLQSLFDQGAQKTGSLFALPADWNPSIRKLPSNGKISQVTASLAKAAKGQLKEVFILSVRPPAQETAEGERRRGPRTVLSSGRGNQERNPEWMAERVQAQIALLPAEEQAKATAQFDRMQALWKEMRSLSPEDRRAKFRELMQDPEFQERMEEFRSARDAKRSPEQREQRMKRYIERKEQMKKNPPQT